MKRFFNLLFVMMLGLFFTANVFAQSPASAAWPLTDPDTGGTGITPVLAGQIKAGDEIFVNTEINHYSGLNNSQRVRIAGNEWPANQTSQLDSVYIQFSVTAKTGFAFNINSVSLNLVGISLNTLKANVYYSSDSTFDYATQIKYSTTDTSGNNYLDRDQFDAVSAVPNLKLNPGETFYLRVYPWVDNDPSVRTGKYIGIQDVIISGETESLPIAASVIWPLQSTESPVTVGSVTALPQSYSEAMKLYGYTNLSTTEGYNVDCAAIQTVSKDWNAEPDPVDSLYFQYSVSPKFGGTFYTESFSLFIGGWYTKNLKAAIYYSKDSTFTTKNVLIPDTVLVGNAVQKMETAFAETIYSGETLYIRVYPHNTQAEGWAKLVAVDSVIINGSTIGVTADPPQITTAGVSDISTSFATSGGNIPSDGGSAVTVRGVVWNKTGTPTISDSKTEDGTGSGAFISNVSGLTAGTTYYIRAYAINDAGTSYGEEVHFTTLDSTLVPTVVTGTINKILVKSAEAGGTVAAWGGDTITVRGVCWNTIGNPTIDDDKTENGSGLGTFTSILYPLNPSTTYYYRAYAVNSKGVGYGKIDTFTTRSPAPAVTKVVAQDGSGDYTTVQAAFDAVPDFYTGAYTILVKKGIYYEKLHLDRNKVNVILRGEDEDSTILTYDDYAGKSGGTSSSQSVAIDADDFTAVNITFQNTIKNDKTFNDQQAVALRVNGDRQSYYNCKLLGYQDTYYTWGGRVIGRIYMKNCYIEGSVDFIFGRDVVLFDSCEIHINRDGGTLTAASTEADTKFGYVFKDCKLSADSIGFDGDPITQFYLGRPWQAAPRTVFLNCYEPASLDSTGWLSWNVPPARYAEFNCFGPGADTSYRASFSSQLSTSQASDYTIENIFSKSTNPDYGYDWVPQTPITAVESKTMNYQNPDSYQLFQNYPNPFNPSTQIKFAIPNRSYVVLTVFNVLGQRVGTLINKEMNAGNYQINFNASNLSSGIYFYSIKATNFTAVKKMMLLK